MAHPLLSLCRSSLYDVAVFLGWLWMISASTALYLSGVYWALPFGLAWGPAAFLAVRLAGDGRETEGRGDLAEELKAVEYLARWGGICLGWLWPTSLALSLASAAMSASLLFYHVPSPPAGAFVATRMGPLESQVIYLVTEGGAPRVYVYSMPAAPFWISLGFAVALTASLPFQLRPRPGLELWLRARRAYEKAKEVLA